MAKRNNKRFVGLGLVGEPMAIGRKGLCVITYRTFRNGDPPRIVDLWNLHASRSRGFGQLAGCDHLEPLLFAKPFFDAKGMFLAFDDQRLVGLCQGGFGCDNHEAKLDHSRGVIAMLMVHPEYTRQGIGTRLVELCESYLLQRGAQSVMAGCRYPTNPFYFGLYGGSDQPGVLETDLECNEFYTQHGFEAGSTTLVFQLPLGWLQRVEDARIPLLRRQVDILAESLPKPNTWWQACVVGATITYRYEMIDADSKAPIGRALVWEMETFGRAWNTVSFGLHEFFIEESRRRLGYGKLLLYSILKHLQDNRIGLVEVQFDAENLAGRGLVQAVGFRQVDVGRQFTRVNPGTPLQARSTPVPTTVISPDSTATAGVDTIVDVPLDQSEAAPAGDNI